MTDEEALKLKPGDPLVGVISGRLAFLEVVEQVEDRKPRLIDPSVRVRRVGKTSGGTRFPAGNRRCSELSRSPKADAPTVHVVADWLEENDEERAAAKLRRAFPLG